MDKPKKLAILAFLMVSLSAWGQPFYRNFFDTNANPVVQVVPGTNISVQFGTSGSTRTYTVNTDTNLIPIYARSVTNGYPWTNVPVAHASSADTAGTATNAPNGKFLADTNTVNLASNYLWGFIVSTNLLANSNQLWVASNYLYGLTVSTNLLANSNSLWVASNTVWVFAQSTTNGAAFLAAGQIFTKTNIFQHDAVGTLASPVIVLSNSTAAALSAQQDSPSIMLVGNGWRTDNSTSVPTAMGMYVRTIQGSSANPGSRLEFFMSSSNSAPANVAYIRQDGALILNGALSATLDVGAGAANAIGWNGRVGFYSPGVADVQMLNATADGFGRLFFGLLTAPWPCLKVEATNPPALSLRTGTDGNYVSLVLSNLTTTGGRINFTGITASNPPTSGAGTAFIFSATNSAGTAEIFTMDGAGVIKQISEHAMDAPDALIDDSDEAPNISKEILQYTGKVRWINRSREARQFEMVTKLSLNSLAYYQFTTGKTPTQWTNSNSYGFYTNAISYLDPLTASQKQIVIVESFAEYNTRIGLNGNGLVRSSWTNDQARFQSDYALSFTNALKAWTNSYASWQTNVLVDTNAIAPVKATWSPPPVQPIPSWLQKRGVN